MEIVAEREVTAMQEGPVTVRKSALNLGRDGVCGVKLAISSTSDHPLVLELHEPMPGHLPLSDVQVHPQYWPGKWRMDEGGHRLVFEHRFPAGGSIETIYGVRITPDQLGPLLGDPVLERVEIEGADAAVEPEPAARPPEDAPTSAGTDAEEEAAAPPPSDTAGRPGDATDEGREPDGDDPDGVVPSMREWPANDGDDAFRYGEDRSSSGEPAVPDRPAEPERPVDGAGGAEAEKGAQLDALRTAVAELRADVESIGRRLEAAGEPAAAIEALRATQAEQAETLAALSEELQSASARPAELTADLRDELQALEEHREAVDERLRSEAERRAELAERLRDADAEQAALRDQLQAAEEHREELSSRLRTEEDERAAVAKRARQLEDQLLELRERYAYRLESLVDRVDELESTFSPDESRAIREVIAAERRWKRQRELRERPTRLPSNGGRR